MLRAMSTRRGPNSTYEKLADERANVYLLQDMDMEEPQLKRVTTLPPGFFSSNEIQTAFSCKQAAVMMPEYYRPPAKVSKAAKSTRKAEKVHPLFGFLDAKRRSKATAKPGFARYIEYLKEGGFGVGGGAR